VLTASRGSGFSPEPYQGILLALVVLSYSLQYLAYAYIYGKIFARLQHTNSKVEVLDDLYISNLYTPIVMMLLVVVVSWVGLVVQFLQGLDNVVSILVVCDISSAVASY
jgi:hypothetical protein